MALTWGSCSLAGTSGARLLTLPATAWLTGRISACFSTHGALAQTDHLGEIANMKVTTVTLLASLVIARHALAVDRLVPSQYATIQAAIDAANAGDVVQISPGSYSGPIDTKGKAITVRGTTDASNTIVSGGESVVRCITQELPSTVIENLTVTNGSGLTGAGVLISGSSPTLRNCRIIANVASGGDLCRGGGIAVIGGAPLIDLCLIGGNTVASTGGPCHPNCNCGSQATSNGYGGGLYVLDAAVAVSNSTISGNLVRGAAAGCNAGVMAMGGGIYKAGTALLTLSNCSISTNVVEASSSAFCNGPCCTATGGGAVIAAPANITNCRISNNSRTGCGELVGGVRFEGSGTVLSATRLCGNSAINYSGPFIDAGGNVVSQVCPACPGDLNGDNQVNGADLGLLLSNWGPCPN